MLILDNPTQGVDVGAKEDIYDIILRLADAGVAVVVLSSEAQEIIRVCDRALVMYHGDIRAQVQRRNHERTGNDAAGYRRLRRYIPMTVAKQKKETFYPADRP